MKIAVAISNAFIIIGCFLPWIHMGELINNKGINNSDAWIILVASVVGLILSIATKKKRAFINLLVGLVCGFVGLINYMYLAQRVESSKLQDNPFSLSLTMGPGLYFILIGSALLIILSIIDVIRGNKEKKRLVSCPPRCP
jgi:uncharacterized membrane protein